MRYRRMGATGLQLSEIAVGTWTTLGDRLDFETSTDLIATAYDLGVNLFDSAETYAGGRAEEVLGRILRQQGWRRETFVICTKIMWGTGGREPNAWGLSRKHVIEGCAASLKRLQLDHIDLLLCHRADPQTPLEETVHAMGSLVRAGKVLYWGTSEWPPSLIAEARRISAGLGVPGPCVDQSRYNLFERQRVEMELAGLAAEGLAVCGWSPLAYGILAGRCSAGVESSSRIERPGMDWLKEDALGGGRGPARLAMASELVELAHELGAKPAVLALAWALAGPHLSSVITGASDPRHLADNLRGVAALGDVGQIRARIDQHLLEQGIDVGPSMIGSDVRTAHPEDPLLR
jgi:voltage-dependent potassium channel beta subunit